MHKISQGDTIKTGVAALFMRMGTRRQDGTFMQV